MVPPQRSICLPKSLLDELNLDGSGASKSNHKKRYSAPQDRKILRKQKRQEKKSQRSRNTCGHYGEVEEAEVDISDPSDIEALTAPPPKTEQKVQSPPPPLPKKSILKKPRKRKAERLEEESQKPASKKKSLSKGVLDKLAQDDAEIGYLEKKLKIKNKKIPKGFEDDGLDFLLDGLKDDYFDDRAERAREINAKQRKVGFGSEEENVDDDEEGGDDERDQLDGVSDIDSGDEEDENREDGEEDDDDNAEEMDEDDEFTGFSDAEPPEAVPVRTVRENPYKAPVAATQDAGKYIPPSLRKPATTESEQRVRLRRQMQGLINRLSEAKLVPLLGNVENLYRTNPRGDVTDLLTDILVSTLCDPSVLQDTYHILHGGFLAGLYKIMGVDVGASVVQRIVEEFFKHHGKVNGIADPSTAGKQCTNLVSFLSELYNLQVVSCVLIFDLIRLFLFELTELHTELLLKVVRTSGHQLRTDDPTALKSLILLLQPAIAKAGGQGNLSTRTKFMIETLTTLKNNRLKFTTASSAITSEATIRMKKLLGGLNTRNLRATEPLRASLEDIKSIETKGKWWLVGSSWAGNNSNNNVSSSDTFPPEAAPPTTYDPDSDAETALPDLQALARQHRMNTDIRRAIFTTLLSSTDYADAHARLFKLHLKRSQEREIPRVLLHCAAAEGSYNPYYTLIARKLCASHALRMTFQFTLWEYFRRFGEDDGSGEGPPQGDDDDSEEEGEGEGENGSWSTPRSLRKVVNLARVYAALVVGGCLGVDILKTLNWGGYLQPATRSFLEVFFTDVFTEARAETKSLAALFGAVKVAENVSLVRGVAYYLRKKVASGDVAVGQEQKAYVRSGVKVAVRVLEDVLKG